MTNKIIVCGSEGSLMSAVIPELMIGDYEILGIDTCERHGQRGRAASLNYQYMNVDLCDANATRMVFETFQPDYVIQAAAKIYGVGGFNKYAADILGDDIALHRNVLDASVQSGVKKVVFISSSMVYENVIERKAVDEMDVWEYGIPRTDYGLSKVTNERLTMAYQKQYGLDYTIWRPFNIITPYETAEKQMGDSHVFADFMQNLVVNDQATLPIYGDGQQVRCFSWIRDVATGIVDHLENEDSTNEAFNIGSDIPVTMRELAQNIRDIGFLKNRCSSSQVNFKFIKALDNDVEFRVPNTDKIKQKLGWTMTKTLDQALADCIDALPNKDLTSHNSAIDPNRYLLYQNKMETQV